MPVKGFWQIECLRCHEFVLQQGVVALQRAAGLYRQFSACQSACDARDWQLDDTAEGLVSAAKRTKQQVTLSCPPAAFAALTRSPQISAAPFAIKRLANCTLDNRFVSPSVHSSRLSLSFRSTSRKSTVKSSASPPRAFQSHGKRKLWGDWVAAQIHQPVLHRNYSLCTQISDIACCTCMKEPAIWTTTPWHRACPASSGPPCPTRL